MADTSQTIQGFYTQAQAKDFARNNLFRVLNINFGTGTEVTFDETDLVYATTAPKHTCLLYTSPSPRDS